MPFGRGTHARPLQPRGPFAGAPSKSPAARRPGGRISRSLVNAADGQSHFCTIKPRMGRGFKSACRHAPNLRFSHENGAWIQRRPQQTRVKRITGRLFTFVRSGAWRKWRFFSLREWPCLAGLCQTAGLPREFPCCLLAKGYFHKAAAHGHAQNRRNDHG